MEFSTHAFLGINRKKQLQEPVNAHRPVTRNFGAQLIKKAQEKAKVPSLFLLPSPSILKR